MLMPLAGANCASYYYKAGAENGGSGRGSGRGRGRGWGGGGSPLQSYGLGFSNFKALNPNPTLKL